MTYPTYRCRHCTLMVCFESDQTCDMCLHNMGSPAVVGNESFTGWRWDDRSQKWWRKDKDGMVVFYDGDELTYDYRLGRDVPPVTTKLGTPQ